jgi:hypothetical protein
MRVSLPGAFLEELDEQLSIGTFPIFSFLAPLERVIVVRCLARCRR